MAEFWLSRVKKYPTLFTGYKYIGSVAGTGAPTERMFSGSGLEVIARRNRLSPEKVEGIMFLKENDELKK